MKCYFFDFSQRRQGPYPDLWIAHLVRAGELDGNVQVWGVEDKYHALSVRCVKD